MSGPQRLLSPDVGKFTMQISQNPAGVCIPVVAVNERSENTASRTRRVETRPRTTRQLRQPQQNYTHGGEKRTILAGAYLTYNHYYTYVIHVPTVDFKRVHAVRVCMCFCLYERKFRDGKMSRCVLILRRVTTRKV